MDEQVDNYIKDSLNKFQNYYLKIDGTFFHGAPCYCILLYNYYKKIKDIKLVRNLDEQITDTVYQLKDTNGKWKDIKTFEDFVIAGNKLNIDRSCLDTYIYIFSIKMGPKYVYKFNIKNLSQLFYSIFEDYILNVASGIRLPIHMAFSSIKLLKNFYLLNEFRYKDRTRKKYKQEFTTYNALLYKYKQEIELSYFISLRPYVSSCESEDHSFIDSIIFHAVMNNKSDDIEKINKDTIFNTQIENLKNEYVLHDVIYYIQEHNISAPKAKVNYEVFNKEDKIIENIYEKITITNFNDKNIMEKISSTKLLNKPDSTDENEIFFTYRGAYTSARMNFVSDYFNKQLWL